MTMLSSKQASVKTLLSHTRGRHLALGVVLGLCLGFCVAQAAQSLRPAHTYSLTSNIKAMAGESGTLEIVSSELALPLLRGKLDSLADSRRRRGGTQALQSFVSHCREGATGGQRGYSTLADDDSDGVVDEDRLDGLDNDGDGLIDEDHAAISDAMTAVHLSQGQGWAQLEFMQWAGTRLQNALFLNLSASHELSGTTTPYYHFESNGEPWREMDVFSRRHDLAGQSFADQATAFVLQVESPASVMNLADPSALSVAGNSVFTWMGVLVLDNPATREYLRPQLEGGVLSLPLSEEPTAVVVCAASSWMQLNRLLLDAVQVYQGVQDPVTQRLTRWIVSPLCSRCRSDKSPDFTVSSASDGHLALRFALESGLSGLLDPDLFVLAGIPLGSPDKITWEAVDSFPVTAPWTLATFDSNQEFPTDLYGLLGDIPDHGATGILVFDFMNPAAGVATRMQDESGPELSGVWLDGRTFVTQGSVDHLASTPGGDQEVSTENSPTDEADQIREARLTLAPNLLEGWPNPFRDQIRIEFVIPSTARELFDWPDDELASDSIKYSGPIAWSGGQPSVSVKIYSINGQELIALQQGSLGEGRYSVSWNGTDAFGRQVASGTYFCKLQLDEWSVTRRLVFIR